MCAHNVFFFFFFVFFFFSRLFSACTTTVQVPGMATTSTTGSQRPTRWPRGLIAAAACSAPCQLRTGGPQLAARRFRLWAAEALSRLRGQRCMSLAGPQPPRHPTSALPNPVRPWRAAWQGHGAHAMQRGAAPSAGIRCSSTPRPQRQEHTGDEGHRELGVTCQLAALCRRNCDPIPLRRSRLGAAIASDK